MRGQEISVEGMKTWQEISHSESRLTMMVDLKKMKVGFGELEHFDMQFNSKFRSNYYQDKVRESGSQSNIVLEAMKMKIRDEVKSI